MLRRSVWTLAWGGPIEAAMDSSRFRRRTIALVAAYAVALQALLLAFVPLAPTVLAGPFAMLCSQHDAAGGTGQPAKHDLPCAALCAAMGHGVCRSAAGRRRRRGCGAASAYGR